MQFNVTSQLTDITYVTAPSNRCKKTLDQSWPKSWGRSSRSRITLKFFVNSCFSHCSAADKRKFPLQPRTNLISSLQSDLKVYLPLPFRWATGFPADPLGAMKNKWTCGLTCDTTGFITFMQISQTKTVPSACWVHRWNTNSVPAPECRLYGNIAD